MLHSYIECGKFQQHTISGARPVARAGNANLEPIINLNQVLAGPIPFDGEEVSLLAGPLFRPGARFRQSVNRHLKHFGHLARANLGEVAPLAGIVKTGIEACSVWMKRPFTLACGTVSE